MQVVRPSPPKFDPDLFFSKMSDFKAKVLDVVSKAVESISDAIVWKRGPAYTFTVASLILLVTHHIDRFWVIFHLLLAGSVVAAGNSTRCGHTVLPAPEATPAKTNDEQHAWGTDGGGDDDG